MACTWLVEDDPPEMRKGTAPTVLFAYSLISQLDLNSAELEEAQSFFQAISRAVERFQQTRRRETVVMKHLARALRTEVKTHA